MANNQRFHVLYTGITGDLPRRVFEHKNKLVPGFTSRYNLTRLVYCEMFSYPGDAIQREKELKRLGPQQEDQADREYESPLARFGGRHWRPTREKCTSLSTALLPTRAKVLRGLAAAQDDVKS